MPAVLNATTGGGAAVGGPAPAAADGTAAGRAAADAAGSEGGTDATAAADGRERECVRESISRFSISVSISGLKSPLLDLRYE